MTIDRKMTVDQDIYRRMSDADKAGFQARSPEGHAAKGMRIQGQEDVWIRIQADTFKNWVNVTLREDAVNASLNANHYNGGREGSAGNIMRGDDQPIDQVLEIEDIEADLADGTRLVALVEALQKRKLRHNKRPLNQHHELENIAIALDAIKEDGIKLVNIGNTDIHNGNLKLILGLIWSLIAHYQLGASNFPPKKLMLAWLKAVLPDCKIKNFTTDWNNGIALSALLDYCNPGLMTNWKNLNPNNGPENCQRAMEIAEKHFRVPMVLEPEYLSSPHLDELSGMTYLSYFMKEESSPGYYATLDWVKRQIPDQRINNFRTDWNDGLSACALVKAKGGPVPGFRDLENYPQNWTSNLEIAVDGGTKLGCDPVLQARDMANPNVEYLGVMAWAAQFQWIQDKIAPGDRVQIQCNSSKIRVGDECNFKIDILESEEVDMDAITAEVIGPTGPVYLDLDMSELASGQGGGTARATFTTDEIGMHQVLVKNEGETVKGTPHYMRSMPKSKKDYDGIEPCAVGSTVEVLINPHHAARPELLEVTAYSPTDRPLGCPVSEENGTFFASFQPDEAGEWRIHVTYDGQDIDHSPFKCMVFNPRAIFIPDQESARKAKPGDPFTFTVDASKTGWGEVAIDVVFENQSIRRTFYVEEVEERIYQVTFTPQSRGKHRVYVYLHGMEVKGSPFSLRIGKDVREPRKQATDIFKADRKVSRYKTHDEQRAERRSYFTEREVPVKGEDVGDHPVAPPRTKHRRQTLQEFRKLNSDKKKSFSKNNQSNVNELFQSEHRTDDGKDLLPVRKTIAFDCHYGFLFEENHESVNRVNSDQDVLVLIKGPEGKKCPTDIKLNAKEQEFTCEFSTSNVGEHSIEIVVGEKRLDNVTAKFYTYDASKINVGSIPPGFVGMPVEFEIDGNGAGFGNLEIIVNGGKVTSHVSTVEPQKKFSANFIPHEAGRHRIDVKFNGEKIGSPRFVEVKDPNTPLMSPGLLTGKIKAPPLPSSSPTPTNHTNGHIPNGVNNNNIIKRGDDIAKSLLSNLNSSDFKKLDTQTEDVVDISHFSSNSSKLKTTTTTNTQETLTETKTYQTKPVTGIPNGNIGNQKKSIIDEDRSRKVVKSSIADKKVVTKMDPAKDFGSFSALSLPGLLLGKPTTTISGTTNNNNESEKADKEESKPFEYGSSYKNSYLSRSNNEEEETTNRKSSDDYSSNKLFTTTISKTVQGSRSNSFATSGSSHLAEQSFVISTDPEVKSLKPVSGLKTFEPISSPVSSYSLKSKETESRFSSVDSSRPRLSSPLSAINENERKTSLNEQERKTSLTGAKVFTHHTIASASKINAVAPPRAQSRSPVRSSASPGRRSKSPEIPSWATKDYSSVSSELTSKKSLISSATSSSTVVSSSGVKKSSSSISSRASPKRSLIPRRTSDASGKAGESQSTSSPKGSRNSKVSRSSPAKSKSLNVTGDAAAKKGSSSPKLQSYRGTAEKCKFEGETVRHFNAGKLAVFELKAPGHKREDVEVSIISPEKRPHIPYKVVDEGSGKFRVEFTTVEVGSYMVDVTVQGLTVPNSPLVAKAYDAGMIRVTDIQDGHVGVLSTFRVDASRAGEGQLEISINDGDVPNAVQVLGGGKCLVTYTPEEAITHEIEVTFNDEQVSGSPFLCRVNDGGSDVGGSHVSYGSGNSKVTLDLEHLGLIPVAVPSHFTIRVAGGDDAELAVSVQGPTEDIPVKVTGNVKSGFTAEFLPSEVGIHMILVEYNGMAVGGTPFYAKAFDSENVVVSEITKANTASQALHAGKTVTFAGSSRY